MASYLNEAARKFCLICVFDVVDVFSFRLLRTFCHSSIWQFDAVVPPTLSTFQGGCFFDSWRTVCHVLFLPPAVACTMNCLKWMKWNSWARVTCISCNDNQKSKMNPGARKNKIEYKGNQANESTMNSMLNPCQLPAFVFISLCSWTLEFYCFSVCGFCFCFVTGQNFNLNAIILLLLVSFWCVHHFFFGRFRLSTRITYSLTCVCERPDGRWKWIAEFRNRYVKRHTR